MNVPDETPPAVIARAGSYDYSAIASLHARCFDEPWRLDLIRRILSGPSGFGLFARCDGEPVGFVLCRSSGDDAEVLSLGVAPARRGLGIGRALMVAALVEARERGVCALFLEVAEDNDAARKLYQSMDFVQVGRRPDYYKRNHAMNVDALTLRRDIKIRDS